MNPHAHNGALAPQARPGPAGASANSATPTWPSNELHTDAKALRSKNEPSAAPVDGPSIHSLVSPSAIFTQNARSTSRRIGGRPGDLIAGLPVCVTNHPDCLPITHLHIKVLRRPLESIYGGLNGVGGGT